MADIYYEGANERILARVPTAAKKILDVGCAAGRLGEILKAQFSDRVVWGIELTQEAATEAKTRLDRVIAGDIEQMDPLPLPDGFFDCLICGDVLEHLKEPQTLLERLRKHLTPGAAVIVNVPNVAHWSVISELLQGRFAYADNGLLDRTHLRFFTPQSLKDMLWEAGYVVTDEDPLQIRNFYDRFGNSTPGDPPKAIAHAAALVGLDPSTAERTSATYQQLYEAKPIPDPYGQPEKMGQLVGPHVGKLGPATRRCSVIVLTYNSMETIEECLSSVLPTLGPDDELIVVDNASQDGTAAYLQDWRASVVADRASSILSASEIPDERASAKSGPLHPSVMAVSNEDNYGFSKGCNIGILASEGEHIIILNPDTKVYPGWVEGLLAPFQDATIAAVGPLSNNVCGDQFVGLYVPQDRMTSPDELEAFVRSQRNRSPQALETKLLIGFCLALRRDLLDHCGLLEESCFLGADDLEISWRLRTLGYRLVVATSAFVSHQSGVSFSSIGQEKKRKLVSESDRALIDKIQRYYGSAITPTSMSLWSNPILQSAIDSLAGSQPARTARCRG